MEHLFSPNSGEDQKKRSSPKMEHFFPRIQVDTYAQIHMQMQTILKQLGGYSQTIGGYIPLIPPGFGTPAPWSHC